MNALDRVKQGRDAYERRVWDAAYVHLCAADRETVLGAADVERLAVASHLMRADNESLDLWSRAHYEYLREGDVAPALRCAFWLGMTLMMRQEFAQGGGWLSRGGRLVEEHKLDCVEAGFLLIPEAARLRWAGEFEPALAGFGKANQIARRFNDADLLAFSQMGIGETLVEYGDPAEGWRMLDEVMTSVTAGALNTLLVGVIYCAVLSACQRHLELRRSQEWTAAFSRWCDSQPGLMPFRGDCLVYRAELLQLRGAWPNALEEARRACAGAEEPSKSWWAGPAFYQQGEVNRLRGDYTGAEEAYRKANEWGCSPQPGLALLRLAQGRGEPALSSLSRALAETQEAPVRARLLAALVEILLAANDNAGAEAAAQELAAIVAERKLPVLEAVSWQATGAVMLAAGDATAALTRLRNALNVWRSLEVPYEAARSRVLMAQACRALGDADSAQLELDTARAAFALLGALPDVRRVDSLSTQDTPPAPGSLLTPRELEVLRLVAAGNTNRAIAETLVLSEKTVARHVSNIFARLGISSRSAATAYAYEHKLIS